MVACRIYSAEVAGSNPVVLTTKRRSEARTSDLFLLVFYLVSFMRELINGLVEEWGRDPSVIAAEVDRVPLARERHRATSRGAPVQYRVHKERLRGVPDDHSS